MSELETVCGFDIQNVLVLFSGGASSAKAIHEKYENVGLVLTDNPNASARHYWQERGIPVITNDIKKFYEDEKQPDPRNMETRKRFDELSVRYVDAFLGNDNNNVSEIDAVVASGYMWKTTDVWLNTFQNRMLNVHPADLSIKDANGKRKYTGDKAVLKALKAGEKETRSTIHLMSGLPDQGPILVRSKPLPVAGLTDEIRADEKILKGFADAHQGVMKDKCDIPAFLYAFNLLEYNEIKTDGKIIYVDGEPYPDGVEVDEL